MIHLIQLKNLFVHAFPLSIYKLKLYLLQIFVLFLCMLTSCLRFPVSLYQTYLTDPHLSKYRGRKLHFSIKEGFYLDIGSLGKTINHFQNG